MMICCEDRQNNSLVLLSSDLHSQCVIDQSRALFPGPFPSYSLHPHWVHHSHLKHIPRKRKYSEDDWIGSRNGGNSLGCGKKNMLWQGVVLFFSLKSQYPNLRQSHKSYQGEFQENCLFSKRCLDQVSFGLARYEFLILRRLLSCSQVDF